MDAQSLHPHIDLADQLVRIFGWPALLSALIWAVRKWDRGQAELKKMSENTTAAVMGVGQVKQQLTTLETNHFAHLQRGMDQMVQSNDRAVVVLENVDKNIAILKDRFPRV